VADRAALPTDGREDVDADVEPDPVDDPVGGGDGDAVGDALGEADASQDVAAGAAPRRRRLSADGLPAVVPRSARALVWQARIGLGVGILGLLLAAVFFLQVRDLRSAEAARAEVLEAGEITALRVTTFDGATIDEWVADTQSLATGDYADEVATLFDTEIRRGLAENQVQSVGEITSSFVQEVDGDEAVVFVVVRQTFTSLNQPQPISDELRMEVQLDLVDGVWRTSDVAVLGPSTVTPLQDTPVDQPGDEATEGTG
jgi:Mce-associated membrane protein